MGRKPTPQPLMLAESNTGALDRAVGSAPTSAGTAAEAASPVSQRSSPFTSRVAPKLPQSGKSPLPPADDSNQQQAQPHAQLQQHQHKHQQPQPSHDDSATAPGSSPASSAPELPQGPIPPRPAIRHPANEGKRPTKSGFFHFNKSSKGSNQLLIPNAQAYPTAREPVASTGRNGAGIPKSGGSPYAHDSLQKPSTPVPSRSELSLSSIGDHDAAAIPSPGRKSKSKTFGLLGRSRSARDEKDYGSPKASPVPAPAAPAPAAHSKGDLHDNPEPLRTAPVAQDRAFRDMMNSTIRNRSEDRALGRDNARERDQRAMPSSLRDNGGSTFLSGLRHSSTRAADMISKGFFGKSSRSGSTTDKEPTIDDEHYVLRVINLPLVEQTRLTRISKRLENSRDKTEFWMPAFPWRAIDYLNYKGCDVEGLYRVPGSGPQIKKWQRRFDEHYDVDLFEADGLYDINIIGSMLKAWLRELPDELFPKEAQDRIARECAGSTEVPQMLIEELSKLSPFNYYLLFAITCHLSLLLAHSDKNKMDFRNLCICFQPCMKIDAFCFRFLVCNWRDCWKGCKSEAKFIEDEYLLFDQPPPRGLSEPQRPTQTENNDGDQVSSPDRGELSTNESCDRTGPSKKHRHQHSGSNVSAHSNASSISTNVSAHGDHSGVDTSRDLRPLSPIKPLSPIGF